jgi:hypothetical protein
MATRAPLQVGSQVLRAYAVPFGAPVETTAAYSLGFRVGVGYIELNDELLPPGSWQLLADVLIPAGHGCVKSTITVNSLYEEPSGHPNPRFCRPAHFKYPSPQNFCWSSCDSGSGATIRFNPPTQPWGAKPGALFQVSARLYTGGDAAAKATTATGPLLQLSVGEQIPVNWPVRVVGQAITEKGTQYYDEQGYTAEAQANGVVNFPGIVLPAGVSSSEFSIQWKRPYELTELTALFIDNVGRVHPMGVAMDADTNVLKVTGNPNISNDRFLYGKVRILKNGLTVFEHPVVRTPDLSLIADQAEAIYDIIVRSGEGENVIFPPAALGHYIAGTPLSAFKAVWADPTDKVFLLDFNDGAHIDRFVGVTTTAAATAGAAITVQREGVLDAAGLGLSPGPVWLGANGALVQTPTSTGYDLYIGTAISGNRLIIEPSEPIKME